MSKILNKVHTSIDYPDVIEAHKLQMGQIAVIVDPESPYRGDVIIRVDGDCVCLSDGDKWGHDRLDLKVRPLKSGESVTVTVP